jgi:glycosyltransferase involved in cell wall biosynthesis
LNHIKLIAPINSLGYGVAGYNLFKELYQLHPSTALYPISQPEFVDEYVQTGMNNRSANFPNSPCVKIWHQNDVHSFIGKGLHVGFPIFELTEFSNEEKLSMSHCDKLFVCSEWAKDVLYNQRGWSSPAVHVVPLGVDSDVFQPCLSSRKTTVFFNCGKWEKRKGHDILLECFNYAFGPNDNVELWMMCDNPFIGQNNEKWMNLYKNSPLGHKIRFIPRQKTHKDVYNIMKQTDCGVFPARAEGWNLELLEMMSCGKQVIATNYSAHTEFCNNNNCHLVDPEGFEPAFDGVFFSGSYGEWASLQKKSKEQVISYMRTIHKQKQEGSHKLNTKGIDTSIQFSWQNSVQELLNGL